MFTLIDLPYKSLAPVISDETLAFHHGKHLQTYVDNLNKLIAGTEYEGKSLEEIVISSGSSVISSAVEKSPAIFNNAGQILNHNLYFTQFCPRHSEGCPCHSERSEESPLMARIQRQWGSLEAFKADFEAKGVGLFGSGWVWLSAKEDGELVILQCPGADNPVAHGFKPLLAFDVWEHAYYLDYQNRRAAHLKALWPIVDWNVVGERYSK